MLSGPKNAAERRTKTPHLHFRNHIRFTVEPLDQDVRFLIVPEPLPVSIDVEPGHQHRCRSIDVNVVCLQMIEELVSHRAKYLSGPCRCRFR